MANCQNIKFSSKQLIRAGGFLFCFYLMFFTSTAQQDSIKIGDADQSENQNLELLSENQESEDNDYTNLIEQLTYFRTHRINLNRTDKDELGQLGLLNELQMNSLLDHIQKNGKLISIYEIQGIDGFDLNTIQRILPFVKVSDNLGSAHFSFSEMRRNGQLEIVSRVQRIAENQRGFKRNLQDDQISSNSPDTFYIGSPERIFTRVRYTYSNVISAGFIAEKDAGEAFRAIPGINKKAGFDFYTAHLFLRNIRFVKAFALGDYQASFGQGLVMWKGYGFGKNANIIGVKRNARGLNQYNSVDESRFLRGAATTLRLPFKLEATVFFSRKKVDANVSAVDTLSSGLLDVEEVSSLITGGLHNTVGALQQKQQITEQLTGGNLTYRNKHLTFGGTLLDYSLSADLNRTTNYYNQFDFKGSTNRNVGFDFSYIYSNLNFFGEWAMSKNGAKAFCGGVVAALDPKVNATLYYRNFDRSYQNLCALPVAENTLAQNEKGLYAGFDAKFTSRLSLSTYFDNFIFPWLKFNVSSPSGGHDFFSQLNWTPSKKIDMYFRYRNRNRQVNATSINMFDFPVAFQQQNFRYNLSFNVIPSVKLRTRIEVVRVKQENKPEEKGFVFFQDIIWKKLGSPISITARYGLFESDSYTTRIYTYENDVLYSFSVPALYDKGHRAYLMMNYDITKKVELWFRVAQTFYTDKSVQNYGDKLTEIESPSKTELKFQVRIKI
jgi:hypothetical protein